MWLWRSRNHKGCFTCSLFVKLHLKALCVWVAYIVQLKKATLKNISIINILHYHENTQRGLKKKKVIERCHGISRFYAWYLFCVFKIKISACQYVEINFLKVPRWFTIFSQNSKCRLEVGIWWIQLHGFIKIIELIEVRDKQTLRKQWIKKYLHLKKSYIFWYLWLLMIIRQSSSANT